MRYIGWIGLLGVVSAGAALDTPAQAASVAPPLVKVAPGGPKLAVPPVPKAHTTAIAPAQLGAFLTQAHTAVAAAGGAGSGGNGGTGGGGSSSASPPPVASFTAGSSSPPGSLLMAFGAQVTLPNPYTLFFNGTTDSAQNASAVPAAANAGISLSMPIASPLPAGAYAADCSMVPTGINADSLNAYVLINGASQEQKVPVTITTYTAMGITYAISGHALFIINWSNSGYFSMQVRAGGSFGITGCNLYAVP